MSSSVLLLNVKQDYKFEYELGKGCYARVHLCKRKKDGASFAIKSMTKQQIKSSPGSIKSMVKEIDIMRAIDHENIIKLYEVYDSDKYIHLVLEYLEGGKFLIKHIGELFNRIRRKCHYSEKDALLVMQNILSPLQYLHEKGIVHRDLKPENLILASKENDYALKIADFGLASFIEPNTLLKDRCGSPGYVAPELLNDYGYNTKADIFSVGVIMFILYLCGDV